MRCPSPAHDRQRIFGRRAAMFSGSRLAHTRFGAQGLLLNGKGGGQDPGAGGAAVAPLVAHRAPAQHEERDAEDPLTSTIETLTHISNVDVQAESV
jgi:hypothetical protein